MRRPIELNFTRYTVCKDKKGGSPVQCTIVYSPFSIQFLYSVICSNCSNQKESLNALHLLRAAIFYEPDASVNAHSRYDHLFIVIHFTNILD